MSIYKFFDMFSYLFEVVHHDSDAQFFVILYFTH